LFEHIDSFAMDFTPEKLSLKKSVLTNQASAFSRKICIIDEENKENENVEAGPSQVIFRRFFFDCVAEI